MSIYSNNTAKKKNDKNTTKSLAAAVAAKRPAMSLFAMTMLVAFGLFHSRETANLVSYPIADHQSSKRLSVISPESSISTPSTRVERRRDEQTTKEEEDSVVPPPATTEIAATDNEISPSKPSTPATTSALPEMPPLRDTLHLRKTHSIGTSVSTSTVATRNTSPTTKKGAATKLATATPSKPRAANIKPVAKATSKTPKSSTSTRIYSETIETKREAAATKQQRTAPAAALSPVISTKKGRPTDGGSNINRGAAAVPPTPKPTTMITNSPSEKILATTSASTTSATATAAKPLPSSSKYSYFANEAQANACRDFKASIATFTETVHNHTEVAALRPFHIQAPKGQEWEFPPLDHALLQQAFGGRRISLMGDSTLFYMLQNLEMLSESTPLDIINNIQHHNLTEAVRDINQYHKQHPRSNHYQMNWFRLNRTSTDGVGDPKARAMWRGFRGTNQQYNCEFEERVFPKILGVKADVMVANWGIHMFFSKQIQQCNLDHWFRYEELLDRFVEVAKESQVKLLLFKTTNLVCSNYRLTQGNETFCNERFRRWKREGKLVGYSTLQIRRYCRGALFREKSARQLNNRMMKKVESLQKRPDLKGVMKIALFNDHDMETCPYTARGDGFHYHHLQLPRIRLLAHTINCLLPLDTKETPPPDDEDAVADSAALELIPNAVTKADAAAPRSSTASSRTALSPPSTVTQSAPPAKSNAASSLMTASELASTPTTRTNVANEAQMNSCRDLSASSLAFANAVHNNTEAAALRKFNLLAPNGKEWEFPPLDHNLLKQAFGGRNITLMGDSTLFYMLQHMEMLSESTPLHIVNSIQNYDMEAGMAKIDQFHKSHPRNDHYQKKGFLFNRTSNEGGVIWRGFRGTNQQYNCEFEERVFPKIAASHTDIMVANWGLHMLFANEIRECNMDHWIKYENLLSRFVEVAKESKVKLLLFKTTNYICPNYRYKMGNETTCNENLRRRKREGNLTNYSTLQIRRYCRGALFREKSARQLNNRMERMVEKFQQRKDLKGMKITLFNDHDMESCAYTGKGDGLHYHHLQLPRVRMLAHMVNCLLPRETTTTTTTTSS